MPYLPLWYQLNWGTPTGEWFIGDDDENPQSMHTPAWCALDLTELWVILATRGENEVVPGEGGRRPLDRELDEGKVDVLLAVTGKCDVDGELALNKWVQLEQNFAALDAFTRPNANGRSRHSHIIMPSGATRTARIQVERFRPGNHIKADIFAAAFSIIVPSGEFALGGS
jgi:hypothetical protein